MNDTRRVGVPPDLFAEPLVRSLRKAPGLSLVDNPPLTTAIKLRERSLHGGLISPLEFGRESSLYRIVRGVAIAACDASQTITLHFREGIKDIGTVAVDPAWSAEIVLTKIILAEEFDVEPSFVPAAGGVQEMLGRADAALLVGDGALRNVPTHQNMVDVVEAWQEMTGMPFVHALWCGYEKTLRSEDIAALVDAQARGKEMLDTIAADASASHRLPDRSKDDLLSYLQGISYDMTADAEEAIREFLRYAYYHGVTPDVADLHFYPAGDEPADAADEPLLN